LRHIEDNANRVAAIKNLGFKTVTEFVASIAANWTQIVRAKEPGRMVLIQSVGPYHLQAIVQLYVKGDRRYWSVVTALPGRAAQPGDVLYNKKETVG
jgi:hypothetical protein